MAMARSRGKSQTTNEDLPKFKKELHKILNKPLKEGDTWFLVDNIWLNRCNLSDTETYPGIIDNKSLFKDDDSGEIRDHMINELDYGLVPEEGWNMLANRFGLKEGQEPIARKVVAQGMFVKHYRVEVYLLEFQLAENSNLEFIVRKKFSRSDTLEHLVNVMRAEFNINQHKETRLWNKFTSNTYEHLARLETTIEHAGLFSGQLIIIEQKNSDGTWPRQVHGVSQGRSIRGIEGTGVEMPPFSELQQTKCDKKVDGYAFKEMENKDISAQKMATKEINDIKDSIRNQYITKIEEINKKVEDEEKRVETFNLKKNELKAKQNSENENMDKKHKDELSILEKNQKNEKAKMEKKHEDEDKKMEKENVTDDVYLTSIKKVRNQVATELEKLDMDPGNDHTNLNNARESLECPVCLEAMKPPMNIWMCPLSHIVCELCKIKLEGRFCPSCRTNKITQRATVAENFARCVFKK